MASTKPSAAPNAARAPKKEYTDGEKIVNFKSAGAKRTMRVVKALRALSGVARPGRYSWTPGQVDKILGTIASELKAVEARFQNPGKRPTEDFTL